MNTTRRRKPGPDWPLAQKAMFALGRIRDQGGGSRHWLRGGGLLMVVTGLVGCGGGFAKTVQANVPIHASTAVDSQLTEPDVWASPIVSRGAAGRFRARLEPESPAGKSRTAAKPIFISLGGIGWPTSGEGNGQRFVGPGPVARWTHSTGTWTVSFQTNAPRVSLVVWSLGGEWQVTVDGKALGAPRSAGKTYSHHDLDVEFPVSKLRTISFALNGGIWLTGLRLGGSADRVALPAAPTTPPSTYWLGDSYVVGSGATYPGFDDLAHVASARAGLSDVAIDALGGTGYVQVNAAAAYPNYLTRARLNLNAQRAQPQLIVIGGSINDESFGYGRVRDAASALYRYLARAVPKAAVVVVPFTSSYPVPAGVADGNRGVIAAAKSAPNVVGVFDLPNQVLALGGVARVERLSGQLGSSVVKYHPSEAGHLLYGRLIGEFLASCVKTLSRRGVARGVCDQAN